MLSKLKAGQRGQFGSYPSTAEGRKAPVTWRVVTVQGDKALLFCEKCIDVLPYDNDHDAVTWERCSLRKYMNTVMLHDMFSEKEQKMLATVINKNPDNKFYHTGGGEPSGGGNTTYDKLFLLSADEIEKMFSGPNSIRTGATEYVAGKIMSASGDAPVAFWLRGPGMKSNLAVYVNNEGIIEHKGYHVNCNDIAVRPAVWLDMGSEAFAQIMKPGPDAEKQEKPEQTQSASFVEAPVKAAVSPVATPVKAAASPVIAPVVAPVKAPAKAPAVKPEPEPVREIPVTPKPKAEPVIIPEPEPAPAKEEIKPEIKKEKAEEKKNEKKAPKNKVFSTLSIILGCLGIILPLILLLPGFLNGEVSMILYMALTGLGLACSIAGLVLGRLGKNKLGLALSILGIISVAVMIGMLYYSKMSYIWTII